MRIKYVHGLLSWLRQVLGLGKLNYTAVSGVGFHNEPH